MLLLVLALSSAAAPSQVHLKTPTASFTHEHQVRLEDGRLQWRTGISGWETLPPDGLPHGDFATPARLTALSADGDNLVALDEEGAVFYMKFHDLHWVNVWGPTGLTGVLRVPRDFRAFAISHRGPLVGGYQDIDGNDFPISAGVTTLYGLSADGRRLHYADPWIPPNFERELCPPLRGRFTAVGMSASASTVFLIDAAGRMFTRLADFDTVGNNPALRYTYERGRHKAQRTLPPEDWRAQPAPPGRVTSLITVLQTGAGNAARELRVEGQDGAGATGYWTKLLPEPTWRFVPTGAPLSRPLLDPASPPQEGPEPGRDYAGQVVTPRAALGVAVRAVRFQPVCSPVTLVFSLGGERLELELHTRDVRTGLLRQAVNDRRPNTFRPLLKGMLRVPPLPEGELGKRLGKLFGKRRLVEVEVEHGPERLRVEQKGWPQLLGGFELSLQREPSAAERLAPGDP